MTSKSTELKEKPFSVIDETLRIIDYLRVKKQIPSVTGFTHALLSHLSFEGDEEEKKRVLSVLSKVKGSKMKSAKTNVYNNGEKINDPCIEGDCGGETKFEEKKVDLPVAEDIPTNETAKNPVVLSDEEMVKKHGDPTMYTNAAQLLMHMGDGKETDSVVNGRLKEYAKVILSDGAYNKMKTIGSTKNNALAVLVFEGMKNEGLLKSVTPEE